MRKLLPNEYKQCLHLWKPVYDEYIRIGYRMNCYPHERGIQMTIDDFLDEKEWSYGRFKITRRLH